MMERPLPLKPTNDRPISITTTVLCLFAIAFIPLLPSMTTLIFFIEEDAIQLQISSVVDNSPKAWHRFPKLQGWIDEHSISAAKHGTGIVIAVKRLNQEGLQGHQEWLLHHPNLVHLIGYCLEYAQRLLVYDFMSRGSLENHLFRRGSYFQPLSWNLRLKVDFGVAKGLAYLHSPDAKVIYRDFKCSNILIDSNYNAKISDIGLAKDGPIDGKRHVSTRVMGTYGFAAP